MRRRAGQGGGRRTCRSRSTTAGPTSPRSSWASRARRRPSAASAQCVEGVCCNEACDGTPASRARTPARRGPACRRSRAPIPGDRCPTEAPTTCGTTGVCDGTGACARYSGNAGVVCATEACVGFMRTTTGTCDSAGGCSGATHAVVHAVPVRDGRQDVPDELHDGRRLRRRPTRCVNGSCGKKPLGASLRRRRRVQLRRSARRAGAARPPARGRASRARSRAAREPAGTSPTAGSARPVRRRGRRDLRARRAVRRQRARAASTRPAPSCGTDSCSAGAEHPARHAATPPAPARPGCCGRAARTCAARRTARPAARPARTASPGYSCVGSVCTQLSNGTPCTSAGDVHVRLLRAGRLLQHRLRGRLHGLQPDRQGRDLLARGRGHGADAGHPVHRHGVDVAAAPTASATARAPAGATPSAPRAAPRAAPDRRCRRRGRATARARAGPATTSSCAPYHVRRPAPARRRAPRRRPTARPGNTCVTHELRQDPDRRLVPVRAELRLRVRTSASTTSAATRACTGTCMSCSLAGSVGTCSPIAAGDPPLVASQCPMAAASTCGNDGTCNGAGACRKYVSGTQCAAATLHGLDVHARRALCNGAGVCAAATTTLVRQVQVRHDRRRRAGPPARPTRTASRPTSATRASAR